MPCVCVCSDAQSCPTLCDFMDYSPPGSSVHGIFQARLWEWVATFYSGKSFQPWDLIGRWILYHWATWKASSIHFSICKFSLSPSPPRGTRDSAGRLQQLPKWYIHFAHKSFDTLPFSLGPQFSYAKWGDWTLSLENCSTFGCGGVFQLTHFVWLAIWIASLHQTICLKTSGTQSHSE